MNSGQNGGLPAADIDAADAWYLVTGGFTAGGQQIALAIVDNGTDIDHPDLIFFKNELDIPDNGIDDDNNGYIEAYDGSLIMRFAVGMINQFPVED